MAQLINKHTKSKMFKSKVLDIKKQGNSLRIIAFSVPDNFSFIPGQYISILFNNTLRRPYSIASVPGKGSIRLLIKLNKGSKSSKAVYELKKGQVIEDAKDLVKDPYVLEFLKIPEDYSYSEKELEQKIGKSVVSDKNYLHLAEENKKKQIKDRK